MNIEKERQQITNILRLPKKLLMDLKVHRAFENAINEQPNFQAQTYIALSHKKAYLYIEIDSHENEMTLYIKYIIQV